MPAEESLRELARFAEKNTAWGEAERHLFQVGSLSDGHKANQEIYVVDVTGYFGGLQL